MNTTNGQGGIILQWVHIYGAGAGAVKKDGCQELGKQQNVVQILLLTTCVGQRWRDREEPA